VRNVKTTISSTLQGTEDTASSSGGFAPNIQQTTERTLVLIDFINIVLLLVVFSGDDLTINFGVTLVDLIESNLLQNSACAQKPGAVGSSIVLQANGKSVAAQLGGRGLAQNAVTIDKRVSNLAYELGVGETNDKTVLGRLVLVLVLAYETLTLTVIGLSFSATTELDLVSRKVSLVLLDLDESRLLVA
jgi:hypothetical protein